MDIIGNIKRKQIEANPEQFKANQGQDSNTSVIFPENVRRAHSRPADLKSILDYFGLFFSMLSDSYNRKYPVPKKTVIVGIFALLYLIDPIDIFPDFIPLLGFVDDIAALAFAASLIKEDLDKYRAWKLSTDSDFVDM